MTEYQHENAPELGVEELEEAQVLIDATDPGDYTIKEIYGDFWHEKTSTVFGKSFKQAVVSGQLKSISFKEINTQNAAVYSVGAQGKYR